MKFFTLFDPKNDINFTKFFKPALVISILVPVAILAGLFIFGITWGIDFSGGTELQVKFNKPVSVAQIREVLEENGFDKNQVQQFGPSINNEMLIRVESVVALKDQDIEKLKSHVAQDFNLPVKDVTIIFDEKIGNQASLWLLEPNVDTSEPRALKEALVAQKLKLVDTITKKAGFKLRRSSQEDVAFSSAVSQDEPLNGKVRYIVYFEGVSNKVHQALADKFGSIEVRRVDFVDSQISKQLRTDGVLAIVYALIAIVIYIAIRFDLFFSPGAIVALVNDTFGALLVFLVGRVEFDTPCIAALLTIVGYSINNTIVIYDRIRETVPNNPKKPLSVEEIKPYVNKAINDTLSRTINTTLTTLFACISIWIFASGVIEVFAMVLTIGITFGAFSSVFISPAVYLLAKKYIKPNNFIEDTDTYSREDKAKGVV